MLARLDKGHTRADVEAVVARSRDARAGAVADVHRLHAVDDARRRSPRFLDDVEALDLVEHVAPVQWTLRLLVTWGSRLLELDDVRALVGAVQPDAR